MIFTGSSCDGSDVRVAKGMYVSPCGTYWSSAPITVEQKAYDKVYDHCARYGKSFELLHSQLASGSKENLPKWVRVWFIGWFTQDKEVVVDLNDVIADSIAHVHGSKK